MTFRCKKVERYKMLGRASDLGKFYGIIKATKN